MHMGEVRMEVVNEHEALEYCRLHDLDFITCYSDNGNLMMLAETKTRVEDSPEYLAYLKSLDSIIEDDYIIYTSRDKDGYAVARMYVTSVKSGKLPISFNISEAKHFSKQAASQKAFFMNKRGKYIWEVLKLGGLNNK